MKILFCSSEVVPFAKTGGLADVSGALPLALEKLGAEVVIAMPKYKQIDDKKFKIKNFKSVIGNNIKVYFIENEQYFNRDGLYQDKGIDYPDNLERFSFFCKETLNLIRNIRFKPDIIHCHDWQAALMPLYLKNLYNQNPFYSSIKTILTIHNLGYQGLFPKEQFPKLGLDWKLFNIDGLEFYDKINFLKGGIIFTDLITTVSPTYSREIQTKEFGCGLEGVLGRRRGSIFGILNGLEYSIWDPKYDNFIFKKYSEDSTEDKYKNKALLQRECHLPVNKDVPLYGIVSRLAEQKGFDILADAIEDVCKLNLQLVILGTGDVKYHQLLEKIAKQYPQIVSLQLKFDDTLAHKIYAASDIFLMPSKYEPCGLGQMISLKYGAIPLVFKTGGLADTVSDKNGFVFDSYSKEAFLKVLKKSIKVYKDKKTWTNLVKKAFSYNFSWEESAKSYIKLYNKII